jgi:DNA-binding Lrp family transcriptional regulator
MSFSDLAKKHKTSVNTIKNRVEGLFDEKVLLGFDVTLKMCLLNISITVVLVEFVSLPSFEEIEELGSNPNIMAFMIGIKPEGFAFIIHRNSDELHQAVAQLRTSNKVSKIEVFSLLIPPFSNENIRPTKSIEDLRQIDWKILRHLRRNGRMHLKELSKRIGKSVPTIRKRIEFMRKHDMIHETTILSMGSVGTGMVIVFIAEFSDLSIKRQQEIDTLLSESYPEEYWYSWMCVDRPIMFLSFYVTNAKSAAEIQKHAKDLITSIEIMKRVIIGEWLHFQDIRDIYLREKCEETSR